MSSPDWMVNVLLPPPSTVLKSLTLSQISQTTPQVGTFPSSLFTEAVRKMLIAHFQVPQQVYPPSLKLQIQVVF